jgi:two-component system sensor histidine kinase HydH
MEVIERNYWRVMIFTAVLAPLVIVSLLLLTFYVRKLFLRNSEYKEQLESQKNLVVVGTAASTLAHEIKNPLLAIRLQTSILQKMYPGQGVDEINAINEEIDKLTSMTYRVNDYLRDAAGQREPLDVVDMTSRISTLVMGRDILYPDPPSVLVNMDKERLRSVLDNVLRNALESCSPEEEITATISRGNTLVSIVINDRGKGIKEEHLSHSFDPFFTSKSKGTGIGLAVSKRFVEAVGGTIAIANREEGGVSAVITLPVWNG